MEAKEKRKLEREKQAESRRQEICEAALQQFVENGIDNTRMEDVAKYVGRIMVMNQGGLVYDDTPKEVFKYYHELEAIGLDAPQTIYIMNQLRTRGLPVRAEALTTEEARDEILRVYHRA